MDHFDERNTTSCLPDVTALLGCDPTRRFSLLKLSHSWRHGRSWIHAVGRLHIVHHALHEAGIPAECRGSPARHSRAIPNPTRYGYLIVVKSIDASVVDWPVLKPRKTALLGDPKYEVIVINPFPLEDEDCEHGLSLSL